MNFIRMKHLLATVLCIAFTAPALATTSTQVDGIHNRASVTVSYADLNLDRPEGRETLYARIKSAARRVCELNSGKESLSVTSLRKQCFKESVDKALTPWA